MPLTEMIPTMSDADLASLKVNALRQIEVGTPQRKLAAEGLLPIIESELGAREAAKPPPTPKVRRKKAAAPVEAEVEA